MKGVLISPFLFFLPACCVGDGRLGLLAVTVCTLHQLPDARNPHPVPAQSGPQVPRPETQGQTGPLQGESVGQEGGLFGQDSHITRPKHAHRPGWHPPLD